MFKGGMGKGVPFFKEEGIWMPYNPENKPCCLYFSKAVSKGLIFGGAYVRREICISKLIGLAL